MSFMLLMDGLISLNLPCLIHQVQKDDEEEEDSNHGQYIIYHYGWNFALTNPHSVSRPSHARSLLGLSDVIFLCLIFRRLI